MQKNYVCDNVHNKTKYKENNHYATKYRENNHYATMLMKKIGQLLPIAAFVLDDNANETEK